MTVTTSDMYYERARGDATATALPWRAGLPLCGSGPAGQTAFGNNHARSVRVT